MVIANQKINIKISKQNKNKFKEFIKNGEKEINIDAEIFLKNFPNRKEIINFKCDGLNCKTEFKSQCRNQSNNNIHLCRYCKIKQTNLERYGVEKVYQSEEIKEKIKQTNLEKYGVENISQLQDIKKKKEDTCLKNNGFKNGFLSPKIKETNLKHYNSKYPLQNEEIKNKVKQTNLERYGVENVYQSEEIKEKIKQTNLEKYGVEHVMKLNKFKEKVKDTCLKNNGFKNGFLSPKIKQTNLEKYGVENPMQNEEIKNKVKQTNLERYGVENVMKLDKIKEKVIIKTRQTMYENGTAPCTKPQKHIYELLNNIQECKLNYPVDTLSLDIAYPEEMIYIEYDGGGHDKQVKCGWKTEKEFKKYERRRQYYLKSKGWKLIRIMCDNDKIPSDEKIIKLIQECKNYLLNNNNTWIKIDLNQNIIISKNLISNIIER